MREMKDSGVEWIGEIPSEWDFLRGKTIFRQRTTKGNTEEVLLSATQQFGMYPQSLIEGVVQVKEETDLQTFKTVHKNDYVISLRSFQGGFEMSDYEGVCSPAYQVLYNIKPIDYRYYKMLFKSDGFISKMNSLTVGIREGKNIQFADFAKTLIPYPPIDEQKRISDYLDSKCAKIDSIIEKQQAIIEKLKEYKLSVVTETVTKGLNPDVEMKDSGVEWIGEIPKSWTVAKLKNYCELKTGSTPSTSEMEWFDGDIKWYTPGDFSENYYLGQSSRTLSQKAKDDNVATIIPKNTVMIVGIGATAGKIGFTKEECSCNQQITALKTKKMDASYLMYWMIANTKFLRETAMFTTLPILNNQTIGNYIVVAPSDIKEEQEIAEFLDIKSEQIESKIRNTYSIINKLLAYKKSLIYEVVTGKKEV